MCETYIGIYGKGKENIINEIIKKGTTCKKLNIFLTIKASLVAS